jgi:phospholipid/cholesterol/gamma-HCH transport system substrate-binding protein
LTANDIRGSSDEQREEVVPPQASKRQVRIGIFVLAGLIATVYLLFLLTNPGMFRGRYMVTTTVDDVMGLRKGDPVQMRGVNIGQVNDFAMGRTGEDVVIVLEVEGQWLIPQGSTTQLVQPGLMAPRTVEVLPGPGPGTIGEGDNMPGVAVRGLLDDTESLGEKGQIALDAINDFLSDKNREAFSSSAEGLENLIGEVSNLVQSQRDNIDALMESLRQAADGVVEATGPGVRDDLASLMARGDSAMGRLNATSESIDGVVASLETILTRIQNGDGTLGQLWASDSLYTSLSETIESARLLFDDIRENPGRFVNLSIF